MNCPVESFGRLSLATASEQVWEPTCPTPGAVDCPVRRSIASGASNTATTHAHTTTTAIIAPPMIQPVRRRGAGCPQPCPGAGCPQPCPGAGCPQPCPGAGCPQPCPGCPPPGAGCPHP